MELSASKKILVFVVLNVIFSSVSAESPKGSCQAGKSCNVQYTGHKVLFVGERQLGYIDIDQTGKKRTTMLFPRPTSQYTTFEARSITYSTFHDQVYWFDLWGSTLYRSSIQNGEPEVIINFTNKQLDTFGISYDWITENVYFTDMNQASIFVCRTDILNVCALVLYRKDSVMTGIAVNAVMGIMFWADEAGEPGTGNGNIYRANMDGSSAKKIVDYGGYSPVGISIDQAGARIYWTEWLSGKVSSALFDGSDRKTIAHSPNSARWGGIDVFGDKMYWVNAFPPSIMSANKFTGEDINVYRNISSQYPLYSLAVFDADNQPGFVHNPCKNAPCSHVCVSTSLPNSTDLGYTCLCPLGMMTLHEHGTAFCINLDTRKCNNSSSVCARIPVNYGTIKDNQALTEKLAIADGDIISISYENARGLHTILKRIHLPQLLDITGIVYNPFGDSLILADQQKIYEYDLKSDLLKVIVKEGVISVRALTIDDAGGKVYWINGEQVSRVEAISLKPRIRFTLLKNMTNMCGLRISPEPNRYLVLSKIMQGRAEVLSYTLDGSRLLSIQTIHNKTSCASIDSADYKSAFNIENMDANFGL